MSLIEKRSVSLVDKYTLKKGYAFMTGIQALVRLPLVQRVLDLKAGLNTAGYISGYRGSPLGGFDQQLERNKNLLEEHHVKFQPGVNEDLAGTALWGTQQAELRGEGKYDGIFGIWYGKGPGVDRSGDVLRHANYAGTSKFGGVLALMGDDHTAESSTVCNQSEFAMVDALIPVLNPSGVQEIYDFGIYGLGQVSIKNGQALVGVRYDSRSINSDMGSADFSNFNGSIGIRKDYENSTLRLNLGSGYRAPNLVELFADGVHHATNRYEIGSTNLNAEKSFQRN